MQKIRCPRCAVINLEKFVTFPRCAGCGGLLPGVRSVPAKPLAPLWRRPLAAVLWASVVGCIVIGLVVAASIFEERPVTQSSQMAVYGQLRYSTRVGSAVTLRPTIKVAMNKAALPGNRALRDVTIRLPQDFFQKFRLETLTPKTNGVSVRGSGRYFHYDVLPRETQLQLTVRALQAGDHRVVATVSAQGQAADEYSITISVKPRPDAGTGAKGRGAVSTSVRMAAP